MKRPFFFALFLFFAVGGLRADDLLWESDYDKAIETAKAQQKPVLLDFSASWCGPCRMMETTFANADVQGNLGSYILVKVDFEQSATLVGKYGVQAIPACFILNQFGERVAEHVGYAAPTAFCAWLVSNNVAAFATVSKNQTAVDRVKSLGAALEISDGPTRDHAAAALMEIYCAKDADDDGRGAKLVEQELRGFVQRHPATALTYLNDRRLGVRILLAALLTEKLGSSFQFDPWETSDARAAAVAAWAKKIDR